MRKTLRLISFFILFAGVATWLATGASRSYTRTHEEIKTVDPVTGLDYIEWKGTFVAGVDFLGAVVVVSGVLAASSYLFRNKKTGN